MSLHSAMLCAIVASANNFMSSSNRVSLFDLPSQFATALPASVLLGQMWYYAATVLYPARSLRALGLYRPREIGTCPAPARLRGEGPLFSLREKAPRYLDASEAADDSIRYFDTIAGVYDVWVQAFTRPIYEEAATLIQRLLPPDARVLDAGCGPGTEMMLLARLVPDGEVVGIDLSAGMIKAAFETSQRRGVHNVAFFQSDVARMPAEFEACFDAVFSFAAFHHYPDPAAAVAEMHRVLNANGRAFVVDPGPEWFQTISSPWAKWADPGWVSFYTGERLQTIFRQAGFSQFYWNEVLPGFGLTIAGK